MSAYPLLDTFFSKNDEDFITGLTALLLSRDLDRFTIWEVSGGNLCKPLGGHKGVTDGAFDLYDLGYEGSDSHQKEFTLSYFDEQYPVYAGFFCRTENSIIYAVTFHTKISHDAFLWMEALSPFIAVHAEELLANNRKMEIFVDYQKKIDFIKESGHILKALAVNEVVANTLNFFSATFHSEAACAFYGDFFIGFGVEEDDIMNSLFVKDQPLLEYMKSYRETQFIDQWCYSPKFIVNNVFIVHEPISNALFLMFNVTVDIVPDKEFSALITHIAAIAIENAKYHERVTKLSIEESEMSQTVEILNQFVLRERELKGPPSIFSVNYPARSTGGDFTTIIEKEDYTFICVADVCGKGYSAAVFTAILDTITDSTVFPDIYKLDILLNNINKYLIKRKFHDRFITTFTCCYDKSTKLLNYIGCGHEPAFLVSKEETKPLISVNLPLGIIDEFYEISTVSVSEGMLLIIYSDGVIEYINHDKLQAHIEKSLDDDPKDIVKKLYSDLVSNPAEQKDDFTCVAIKF
ncbi:MAG: serine/threonine-protein phosphatase [Deferribacteraceae bacterium]|jgi:serine phosphatase RsbU (regulator of sigma subunit)|nr:serine/threonine-protein phosphatase [Deferribacteraceae bacterium]